MKKTVMIGESSVVLESNAATPFYYKQQFGSDFFKDLIKVAKVFNNLKSDSSELDLNNLDWDDLDHLDITVMYQIAWATAKTADSVIPEPIGWLASFSNFPISAVTEIVGLVTESMNAKKK